MALNLMDLPASGNGGWFKPKDNADAVAILLEVLDFEHQRPTPNGPKDSALADITVFNTQAELDAGKPSSVNKGMRVEQTVLARDMKPLVGGATVVVLAQVETKKAGAHPAWVWRKASPDAIAKVVEYANARDAAVEEAVANAPSFD